MAQFIETGKTEAIQLHHVRSYHIRYLEETAEEALLTNRGFGQVIFELAKGVYHKGETRLSQLFGRSKDTLN